MFLIFLPSMLTRVPGDRSWILEFHISSQLIGFKLENLGEFVEKLGTVIQRLDCFQSLKFRYIFDPTLSVQFIRGLNLDWERLNKQLLQQQRTSNP